MVQLIGKLMDLDGNPSPDTYILFSVDADRLEQIMYRICDMDDRSEDDDELTEARYICPYVEVFKPTSKALRRRVERLLEQGDCAFLAEKQFVKLPAKSKLPLDYAIMIVVPGAAGFEASVANSKETIMMNNLSGDLWEATFDALRRKEGIEIKKEPEPKKHRSYFA